jgi:hypothetical protein
VDGAMTHQHKKNYHVTKDKSLMAGFVECDKEKLLASTNGGEFLD